MALDAASPSDPVRCNLCGDTVELRDLMGHLRDVHDQDIVIETWPDGEPVVVDRSLEPRDFIDGR